MYNQMKLIIFIYVSSLVVPPSFSSTTSVYSTSPSRTPPTISSSPPSSCCSSRHHRTSNYTPELSSKIAALSPQCCGLTHFTPLSISHFWAPPQKFSSALRSSWSVSLFPPYTNPLFLLNYFLAILLSIALTKVLLSKIIWEVTCWLRIWFYCMTSFVSSSNCLYLLW